MSVLNFALVIRTSEGVFAVFGVFGRVELLPSFHFFIMEQHTDRTIDKRK